MKKTLIAMAALAATGAFAQSSVVITGLIDAGVNVTDYKGNSVTTTGMANGSATSNFTFLITEDIGGGMKARARWEIDPDLNNTVGRTSGTAATGVTSNVTSFLSNGESFLALDSAIGTISFGANNLRTLIANGLGNSNFATAVGSGYRVSSFDAVRFQNSLRYETPDLNGFKLNLNFVAKNDLQRNGDNAAAGNNVNQYQGRDGSSEIGLAYAAGPVALQYAHLAMTQDAASQNTLFSESASGTILTAAKGFVPTGGTFTLDTLAGSWNFGTVSVAGFYQTVSSENLLKADATGVGAAVKYDRKTTGISATYALSPTVTLRGNYQNVALGDTDTAGVAGKSTTVLGLGVDYAFSKRTNAYLRYESDKDDAGVRAVTGYTAATGNTTYTATAVGIRHTF